MLYSDRKDDIMTRIMKKLSAAIIIGIMFFSPYIVGIIRSGTLISAIFTILGIIVILLVLVKDRINVRVMSFIFSIVICCFALAIFDLSLRPILKHKLYYRPYEMFANRFPAMPVLLRYPSNITYRGETFGDLAAMSNNRAYGEKRKVLFQTDSLGFKNDNKTLRDPIDIILLGDSFGAGEGTSQEKTWASIFKQKYGFNTYNLSFPGGPWDELMNLKIEFDKLKCRKDTILIWAIFTGNDLDDKFDDYLSPRFKKYYKRLQISYSTFRYRSPIRQLIQRFKTGDNDTGQVCVINYAADKNILFYNRYLKRKDRTYDEILHHENYGKFNDVFNEMKEFAKQHQLKVIVVLIPSKGEVYDWLKDGRVPPRPESSDSKPSGFSIAVKEICQKTGFLFLDLKPSFIGEAKQLFNKSGELLWWRDDTHWNDRGHELAASLVYDNVLSGNKGK